MGQNTENAGAAGPPEEGVFMAGDVGSNAALPSGGIVAPVISGAARPELPDSAIDEALERLAESALRMLPEFPIAVSSLRRGPNIHLAAAGVPGAIPELPRRADGSEPCLSAIATLAPVRIRDATTERRYADHAARLVSHGLLSAYCHPFRAGADAVGALSVYAREIDAFGVEARRMIAIVAEHSGLMLEATLHALEQTELAHQLRRTLQARSEIDQALGILMAQERCGREAAFRILRTASQNRNIKVAELASRIVSAVSGAPPERAPFQDAAKPRTRRMAE